MEKREPAKVFEDRLTPGDPLAPDRGARPLRRSRLSNPIPLGGGHNLTQTTLGGSPEASSILQREGVDGLVMALNRKVDLLRNVAKAS